MNLTDKHRKWTPASLCNERGIVLPIGLVLLVLVAIMGGAAVKSTNVDLKISGNYKTGIASFHLAEAAAEYVRNQVGQNKDLDGDGTPDRTQVFTNGQTLTWDSSNILDALKAGTTGTVTVNPLVGNQAEITSTALVAGSTQTVKMVVEGSFPVPPLPAAVTVVSNGENEFDFEDDTVTNGVDESGTCGDVWGLVSSQEGFPDPDLEGGWLGGLLSDGTTGGGTTDDTASWREFGTDHGDDPFWADPQNVYDLVTKWENLPGTVTITGSQPATTNFGTADNPQITLWDVQNSSGTDGCDFKGGPCVMQSTKINGYGILIVNGEIKFKNDIVWNGLIVQKSDRQITFQKKSEIHGAVIAASTDNYTEEATKVDFEDDTTLNFNCQAIEQYAGVLVGGFEGGASGVNLTVVSWKNE